MRCLAIKFFLFETFHLFLFVIVILVSCVYLKLYITTLLVFILSYRSIVSEMNPMGAEDIVAAYNDFRSDVVLLQVSFHVYCLRSHILHVFFT